ncbi:MAG: NAD(+)/NADH kinase [Deltaproteobacteria bacterium]|nr:NAD(+)/NADH kinase [Deltaproteobacteria bacterium]
MLTSAPRPVGLILNPMSGRDVRRLVGRAQTESLEVKRSQLARAVVGAAAAGATHFHFVRDVFRLAEQALEYLALDGVTLAQLDVGPITTTPADTARAVLAMRDAGCAALLVMGGDGTSRIAASAWPDAPLVALSLGTNNVFPERVEATLAGAAVGLVASGKLALEAVAQRAKVVRARFADGAETLALIDAVLVADDHPGSLLPFDAGKIRRAVLSRAEPDAVGMSPLGGLLLPTRKEDDAGVDVACCAPGQGGRALLTPISPGLYRTAFVTNAKRVALGEPVIVEGPGILEFDGDRERVLAPGERAELRVVRDGPWQIDVSRALTSAAQRGLFLDLPHWHDEGDSGEGPGCC